MHTVTLIELGADFGMRVRVKGRPGNRITNSAHPELHPVWSVRQGVKIGPSVDLPGLPASRNPHGFGHSECGAWWAVMPLSLVILAGCDRAERRLVGSWPTKRRAVPSAPGVGRTRHPRMGAAQQLWLLYRNHRGISDLRNVRRCRAPRTSFSSPFELQPVPSKKFFELALVLARFAPSASTRRATAPPLPATTRHPLPTLHSLFVSPLFSYSYELLFPQPLYFDNHPHCPGVWGYKPPISLRTLCLRAAACPDLVGVPNPLFSGICCLFS